MAKKILIHSGVKGMKWGIRKRVSQMRKERNALRARKAEYKKTMKERKMLIKNRHTLSDDQLRALMNRINLEQQLVALNDSNIGKGKKELNKWTNATGDSARNIYTGALTGIGLGAVAVGASKVATKLNIPNEIRRFIRIGGSSI